MSKCVTSERCCEIWNLIHEEAAAAAALVGRRVDYCKPCLNGTHGCLKMLLLATGRGARAHQSSRYPWLAEAKTKGANVSKWILSGRQRGTSGI